jgi:hypothetical protein
MTRRTLAAAALLALAGAASAQDKLAVKVEDTPTPKELADPVRALLDTRAMTVTDDKGKAIATVWPRKELEARGDVAAGYTALPETTILGAVRFPDVWVDYRKQKIKPGVYTLRLGFQPMDGDHMGTAPYNEFALLVPADLDKTADPIDVETLHEESTKATTRRHPGIMLLFPNPKPADKPAIESKPQDHHVLSFARPVKADGKESALGFSLVLLGYTMAE